MDAIAALGAGEMGVVLDAFFMTSKLGDSFARAGEKGFECGIKVIAPTHRIPRIAWSSSLEEWQVRC